MAISPTTRMPAKISRQTWAPREESFASSIWTGGGTRFTRALPRSGNAKKRLATFGERLATPSGQFGESTCDRLVHSSQVPDEARPSALVRPPLEDVAQANKRESGVAVEITGDAPVCSCSLVSIPQAGPSTPLARQIERRATSSLRAEQLRGRKIG